MHIKEYLGYSIILLTLILLSQTSFNIGMKKFDQLACTAHLNHIYTALIETLETDPNIFAKHPETPWYQVLASLKTSYLLCPAFQSNSPTKPHPAEHTIHYALNNKYYDLFKSGKTLPENEGTAILLLDSEIDPVGFQLYPFTNPSFRHNGGCMILQADGSVKWIDKDAFGDQTIY